MDRNLGVNIYACLELIPSEGKTTKSLHLGLARVGTKPKKPKGNFRSSKSYLNHLQKGVQ